MGKSFLVFENYGPTACGNTMAPALSK